MFALAAAGFEGRSPLLFGDNPGKTAPDANICRLKTLLLQPLLQLFLRPLSSLTAPAYERSGGERVVYEPGGDHLG